MARTFYSPALYRELAETAFDPALAIRRDPVRYEAGERLTLPVEGLHPPVRGESTWRLERFLGGGFAGQVYRARLEQLEAGPDGIPGLEAGGVYALKLLVPPSGFRRAFRNLLFHLAYQGPFSAQASRAACRAGALWQKVIRRAAGARLGREDAVKDVYATVYDARLRTWGEVTEWVEGRTWRLESDPHPARRRGWRRGDPSGTGSPEYLGKRRFMAGLVGLLREMGAAELARQFEWWTMKSQPNVLLRTDRGTPHPEHGLCAIDFRAGLALLPFLPMSPADLRLVPEGLFRRGALVQFDRPDPRRFERFVAAHAAAFADMAPLLADLRGQEAAYRRSLPDLTRTGWRLLVDPARRRAVRRGLADGYVAAGLADPAFADGLAARPGRFAAFYLLGALPFAGRRLRRLWGEPARRAHLGRLLRSRAYRGRALRSRAAWELLAWCRAGRADEAHARRLAARPWRFWLERLLVGWVPFPAVHRALAQPARVARRLREGYRFLRSFLVSAAFRERWFLDTIEAGRRDGMLSDAEAERIRDCARDPFIAKYLKCLGVHFATLPVTQVVSVAVGAAAAGWMLAAGRGPGHAAAAFGLVLVAFQVLPVSPGSLCRGGFVVYLMLRERNLRDYVVAAPVSFLKYLGYLAFPLQMTTTYPALARFMAARWATGAVHAVPVFGERGALLEHAVFDACFNWPQAFGRWAGPRARGLLNLWMLAGAVPPLLIDRLGIALGPRGAVNAAMLLVAVFVLPRVLFYPLLAGRRAVPSR